MEIGAHFLRPLACNLNLSRGKDSDYPIAPLFASWPGLISPRDVASIILTAGSSRAPRQRNIRNGLYFSPAVISPISH